MIHAEPEKEPEADTTAAEEPPLESEEKPDTIEDAQEFDTETETATPAPEESEEAETSGHMDW